MTQPRRFYLQRNTDPTGVSGTGHVADGVCWPDGTVSIRWTGDRPSIVHWGSLADAEHVHGHVGATRFVWLDSGESSAPAATVGPIQVMPWLVIQPYRRDQGGWAWVVRCWGHGTCDGHLALDLSSRQYAERKAAEHLAAHPEALTIAQEPS